MKIGEENKRLVIGFGISVIFHFALFFPFAGQSIVNRAFAAHDERNADNPKEETVLLASDAPKEMIPEQKTPFVSDRNTAAAGKVTKETGYNIYARDNTKVKFTPYDHDAPASPDLIVDTKRGKKQDHRGEPVERKESGEVEAGKQNDGAQPVSVPGQEAREARRMPYRYDEDESIKVGFSIDEGRLNLGSRLMPYASYCIEFVNSIRESYEETRSVAIDMGILKDDEVEVLFSINAAGKIEFESVTKDSIRQQENFKTKCIMAVQYAAPVSPPPYELMRDEGQNGKIYIPFKFMFKNIRYR